MAAENGAWGDVFDTSIIGIHQTLLEDGRVLYWGGDGNGNAFSNTQKYGIFDPSTGQHEILEAGHVVRMFCGAGVIIPGTDKVLIAGGNGSGAANGQVFDLSDMTLTLDPAYEMAGGRFYPTTVSLSSGQVVILGGNGDIRATPEIFTLGEGWRTLDGATDPDLGNSWWYPRTWVTDNGQILYIAVNAGNQNGNIAKADTLEVMLLDPSGDGSVQQIGNVPFDMDVASVSAMYDTGKIIMQDAYGDLWYMDITGDTPVFTFAYDFATDRNNADMTVLPDGRVLINGGTTVGNSQDPGNAILDAVIFDPFTGTATTVDAEDVLRLYHSSSLLLADGTILSMGGGGLNGTLDFMDAQIYQPDYLFNEDGTLADRPEITSAPEDLIPGESFVIEVSDASSIARLSFVKTGSVTHSVNMEAGRMDLAFEVLSDTQIAVTLPDNPNIVGAGNWMLFAIDANGVPSVAPIMSVQPTLPLYTDGSGQGNLFAEYFAIPASTTTLDTIDFDATPIETEFVSEINETGTFYPGGPADNFAARYTGNFEADAAGTYTFFLTSDDGSRLYIDGQLVIDNDALQASTEKSVSLSLSAGSHTIEVRYFERGGQSSLDLDWSGPGFARTQMSFETAIAFEPNETLQTATDLGVLTRSDFADLAITTSSDGDFYRFTASETGQMTASALFDHLGGDIDIELYDASGSLIAISNSTTDDESITFNTVAGTDYILLVEGYTGATNDYQLSFRPANPDRFEGNDTPASATDLGTLSDIVLNDLTISSGSDQDHFRFTAAENGLLNLSAVFSHAAGDLDLQVLDASGQIISISESVTNNESLSFNAIAGQSYTVLVYGYAGATNEYALALSTAPSSNDTFETATNLGLLSDASFNGLEISTSSDQDFYRFTAAESGRLSLSALFQHASGDLDLQLFDTDGNLLATSETVTNNETVAFDILAGTDYVLRVFGYEGAANAYSLTFATTPTALFEPNETFETAANLGVLSSQTVIDSLGISSGTDRDFYAFTAGSSGTFDLSTLFAHGAGDLDLALYDAEGNLLGLSESLTNDESVTVEVTAGARYIFQVYGYEGATNEYALSLGITGTANLMLFAAEAEDKSQQMGGDGFDMVTFTGATEDLTINLQIGTAQGALLGTQRLTSIEGAIGGSGDDKLIGNDDINRLQGGAGDDTLEGHDGNDVFVGGAGADRIDGGAGFDLVDYSGASQRIVVNLDTSVWAGQAVRSATDGQGGTDSLRFIEDIRATQHDDLIFGSFTRNTLFGEGGNDALYGRGGNDTLSGGTGSNLLDGASGLDTASYAGINTDMMVNLSLGTAASVGSDLVSDTLISIEAVSFEAGTNSFVGDALNNRMFGGSGTETADGGDGNDILFGEGGNDVLSGGRGSDRLYGGDHTDELFGADGIDVLDGGAGDDLLDGGADGDRLYGRSGDDLMSGGSGLDMLYGQEGADVLNGGADRDYLFGGDGDDTLTGGAGNDRLIGGDGIDTAVFSGNLADYDINFRNGVVRMTDLNGTDGFDKLTEVEFLQFADGVIDVAGL